jgi:transcriptional regulator with XRE-family HTH domain
MEIPKLKEWRERRGLTQRELAELAGVSLRGIAGYEAGQSIRPNTARKVADALEVAVEDLLNTAGLYELDEREKSEVYPKGRAPLPIDRPEVKTWLKEQGAKYALMTNAEFQELVLNMEAGAGEAGDALLEDIERLVGEITDEDRAVEHALMGEFTRGGELFPKPPAGPDHVKRAFARHRGVMQLKRAFADRYQALRLGLMNYSMRLYEAGRASDFLVHPRLAEPLRRRMLEEAFAEEATA